MSWPRPRVTWSRPVGRDHIMEESGRVMAKASQVMGGAAQVMTNDPSQHR